MSAITMSSTVGHSLEGMCTDAVRQATALLAKEFKFDFETAEKLLRLDELKVTTKDTSVKNAKKAPKESKSKKSKKTDSDGEEKPKVKRGPTGYLLYANSIRAAVTAELQSEIEGDGKVKSSDVTKVLGPRWKALSDETKAEWNTTAKTQNAAASSSSSSDSE